MSTTIPAITLWQPWASWIAWGWKDIETRHHAGFARLAGQRIAIHAGLQFDHSAVYQLRDHYGMTEKWSKHTEGNYPRGAVVCTAMVVEHRRLTAEDSRRAIISCNRLFGLVLTDVQPCGPFPARGKQGIWNFTFPGL